MNDTVKLHPDESPWAASRPGHARRRARPRARVCSAVAACLAAALLASSALVAQEPRPAPPPSVFSFVGAEGAFLGVSLKDVTAADVGSMKLPGEYGAVVTRVESASPAAKAGLQVNDVILEFADMRVWSADQLAQLVRETPPGRTVSLRVSRAGQRLNLQASLASRPGGMALMPHIEMPQIHISPRVFNFSFFPARYRLGVQVEALTSQLAAYFGVKQGKGVLVTEVEADGPAAKAGMKAGDCIVRAGSTDVAAPADLTRALNDAKNSEIALSIVRAGREETLTAKLEAASSPTEERIIQRRLERQVQALQRQTRVDEMQRRLRRAQERMLRSTPGVV